MKIYYCEQTHELVPAESLRDFCERAGGLLDNRLIAACLVADWKYVLREVAAQLLFRHVTERSLLDLPVWWWELADDVQDIRRAYALVRKSETGLRVRDISNYTRKQEHVERIIREARWRNSYDNSLRNPDPARYDELDLNHYAETGDLRPWSRL